MGTLLQPMTFEMLDQVEAWLWVPKNRGPARSPLSFRTRTPHLDVGPPFLFREFSPLIKKKTLVYPIWS